VADAGGLDLDQHFALARPFELDGGYFQRFSGGGATAARTSMAFLFWFWVVVLCQVISRRWSDATGLAA
jgi:hypothetical protein